MDDPQGDRGEGRRFRADPTPDVPARGRDQREPEHRRALVVEDTDEIRVIEVLALEQAGWEVQATGTGAEGLDRAVAGGVDVIILDLELPDMDGLTVLTALRDDPRTAGIPVVLVTARSGIGAVVRGLAAGAHDYLSKPFDARELCDRAANAVAARDRVDRAGASDRLPRREPGSASRLATERLGALLDQMPGTGVLLFDMALCLELGIGPVARRVLGADPIQVEGRHGAALAGLDPVLIERLDQARLGLHWSGTIVSPAGSLMAQVAPLLSRTGQVDGVAAVLHQIP